MREKYTSVMGRYMKIVTEKGNIDFADRIKEIEEIINLEDEMLAAYCAIAELEGMVLNKFTQMAVSIISKNNEFIYTTLILTKGGEYAAARVIFRNIYESLIILKTVSITNNQELLEDWFVGKSINMRRDIYNKITYPKSKEMNRLWGDLCKFCHGTIASGQHSHEYSTIKRALEYNYVVIEMLLYMNYHVLNRYVFLDGMKAMADRNIILLDDISIKEKRNILRNILKESKNSLAQESKKVLTDFTKVWKFS